MVFGPPTDCNVHLELQRLFEGEAKPLIYSVFFQVPTLYALLFQFFTLSIHPMFGKRYDSWDAINLASRDTFLAEERPWDAAESLLGAEAKPEQDSGSGVSSPPLWRTSPARGPQNHRNSYRNLSPESRTQAIVRGQRELMEMVRNLPESCYELSLKDLVEHPMVLARQEETTVEERDSSSSELLYRRELSKKKNQQNALIRRDRRIDNGGFYLKMMFPLSLGSTRRKTKKNESGLNNEEKPAGKPSVSDGSAKVVEKEWWKKRASFSCGSESGGSSLNSGSVRSSGSSSTGSSGSSRSIHRHGNGGCWSCMSTPRTAEN